MSDAGYLPMDGTLARVSVSSTLALPPRPDPESKKEPADSDWLAIHPRFLDRILRRLIEAHPENMELKTAWIEAQLFLALYELSLGLQHEGGRRLKNASRAANEMLCFDPTNPIWTKLRDSLDRHMSDISSVTA